MEKYEKIEAIDDMEAIRKVIEKKITENLKQIKMEENNGKKN